MRKALITPVWPGTVFMSVGGILFSQALSFGWYRKDFVEFSSHVQSLCLCLAGIAFIAMGFFIRVLLIKLAVLEKELSQLKTGGSDT